MNIRNMTEVGLRLEKAVIAVSDESITQQDMYDLYEQAAIHILDSEFDDYPEGVLEAYLRGYLERKCGEFNLKFI